jgi:hypothetical protein
MCLCESVLFNLHCQIDVVAAAILEAIKDQIGAAALPHQSAERVIMCNANEVIEQMIQSHREVHIGCMQHVRLLACTHIS